MHRGIQGEEAGEQCGMASPQEANIPSWFPGTREFFIKKFDILERGFV